MIARSLSLLFLVHSLFLSHAEALVRDEIAKARLHHMYHEANRQNLVQVEEDFASLTVLDRICDEQMLGEKLPLACFAEIKSALTLKIEISSEIRSRVSQNCLRKLGKVKTAAEMRRAADINIDEACSVELQKRLAVLEYQELE